MELERIKVALCSNSDKKRALLKAALDTQQVQVVMSASLNGFLEQLEQHQPNVVLLNINENIDYDEKALYQLIDTCKCPVLYEDEDSPIEDEPISIQKIHKLAVKLQKLVQREPPELDISKTSASQKINISPIEDAKNVSSNKVTLHFDPIPVIPDYTKAIDDRAINIWILAASVGGPDAVKKFLAKLPKDFPVAFILAQHLGENCIGVLANQLHRVTPLKVLEAQQGHFLRHSEVIVSPMDKRLLVGMDGRINLIKPDIWKGHYHPSIECIINDVCMRYKHQAGIIIFSGMGQDGVDASERFYRNYRGVIWAQNAETCVVSSMPDVARSRNIVALTATPEELAHKLIERYDYAL